MKKFKPNELCLKEFNHWIIILRQKQLTLGDAVIILKREIPSIAFANEEEFAEFPAVVDWYEKVCNKLFTPDKYNYVAAMMKDNFVHFHAFPRYSSERDFAGKKWIDGQWAKPIALLDCAVEENILEAILTQMKED